MSQVFQSCKKGTQLYVPTTLDFLAFQKTEGYISNTGYVLMALQAQQPYQRVHVIRPHEFRRHIGAPWPGGEMPERSFNQAIRQACKDGAISVTKDPDGTWLVATHHDVFSYCDPAKVCRSSGKILPNEAPKPAQGNASSSPKKEHDRIFKNNFKKEQEPPSGGVVSFSGKPDSEESTYQRSVMPIKKSADQRSENSSQKSSNESDTARHVDRDKISAALAASCKDENFVRTYVEQAPESELRGLEKIITQASEAEIRDAIAAMKQQRQQVRSPIRWLITAIKNRFKPNSVDDPGSLENEVKRWRQAAADKGIVNYTMLDKDAEGGGVASHNYRIIPLDQAMEFWPYEWIIELPEHSRGLLDRAVQRFKSGYFGEVDEILAELGMRRSPEGYLLPDV